MNGIESSRVPRVLNLKYGWESPNFPRHTGTICFYLFLLFTFLLLLPDVAHAHVGSKDVYETVHAGPYTLDVTVRPPNVIPGIATVEVRSSGAPISGLRITPLPLTGEAALHPPAADIMERTTSDAAFYTGGVWIMSSGTWQVRFQVEGAAGPQTASVPVLAVPISTLHMQPAMGFGLAVLGLFLVISMAGIVAAAIRDSRLRAGIAPPAGQTRGGRIGLFSALAIMAVAVVLGGVWWNVEAASYAENIYRQPVTSASLTGNTLDLHIAVFDPHPELKLRWSRARANDDYLPDHGKLIHLYAIREPEMDVAFHLHPDLVAPGDFRLALPAMPPGIYRLYGDVVHKSGFPETLTTTVTIPAGLTPNPLAVDDAEATPAPLSAGLLGPTYTLPDGYRMLWKNPATLSAQTLHTFRFELLDPTGRPAKDMQPYLGMAGHAAFVKTDGSVFAHTHPEGSVAMADIMLSNPMTAMAETAPITSQVGFPYGFPTPGQYRIFIQMKHGTTVETGAFDAQVR